eukprot:3089005-Rhodomonas_salina.1
MPGTGIANDYMPTRVLCFAGTEMAYDDTELRDLPTRCPVPTSRMMLPGSSVEGGGGGGACVRYRRVT